MARRLVTEADVLAVPTGGELRVGPDDLVTPAARDRAFLRGIRLVPAGAASSRAPRPTTPRSALPGDDRPGTLEGLPDGDYLVEIRGGSVRIRRIDNP